MKWTQEAEIASESYYEKIKELPFIKSLMDGSLNREQFAFYINQDSIYLGEYGKILAGIGAKLTEASDRNDFLKFAADTIFVEQELHKDLKTRLSSTQNIEVSPTCLLYTSYLHKQLAQESIEVAVAAALPCFCIYKKIGEYILQNQTSENNPYQKWIDTYGGEEFTLAVNKAMSIANRLAIKAGPETYKKMIDSYITATKMEWMFWNSAYEMEQWPL